MADKLHPTGEIPEPDYTPVTFGIRDNPNTVIVQLPGNARQVADKIGKWLHTPSDKPHWFRFEDIHGNSYIYHTQSISTIKVNGGSQ